MVYNESLNRASGAKRAYEIEHNARLQEQHFARLRASFQSGFTTRRSSNLIRRTALLLKTFFLNF